MKVLNRTTINSKIYPTRIVQFGEGNFLRAFVDWIVWNMNRKTGFNSGVTVVQPIPVGMVEALNAQDGLYHLALKGIDGGKPTYDLQLIDVVNGGVNPYTDFGRYLQLADNPVLSFVISNTTEAGIAFVPEALPDNRPAESYPGKLTQLLYRRFKTFGGARDKGLIIFPCELIFENGKALKACINKYIEHWALGDDFADWFAASCGVYSTLVDRIVPGYPRETADEGEIFHLWVIEAPESVAREFPAREAGLNVLFVPDEAPYHERKVTLLNGPHTVLSPVGHLAGFNTVRECVEDAVVGQYVRRVMYDELMPSLNLPPDELAQFAADVLDRFRNPYINHQLASIMLNAFPKYKTRDLPGLKKFVATNNRPPEGLTLGLAAIIVCYKGDVRADGKTVVQDAPETVALLQSLWATGSTRKIAEGTLAAEHIWGENLNDIAGLTDAVAGYLDDIQKHGILNAVQTVLSR